MFCLLLIGNRLTSQQNQITISITRNASQITFIDDYENI
ncbi:hypothetical protein HMPREF9145_0376 [Segatella salivae F0493]|uniref:Uncharacterized protein n=1 Tax=Segatella salivae F0493 TaxID=1395125 RepID=U2LBH4_9BACT|nr:hypothetical protein HMPREF9145_0376 [Segatella salivae F0493]